MEHMMENMKTEMRATDVEPSAELGFGAQLRQARERAGLGRAEVARNLRVTDRVIECLEYELFDELPPPIFVRGYLRQYAAMLRIPSEEIIHLYNRTHGERPAPLIRESLRQRLVDRQLGFRVWPVLTVLVVVATLLGLWLFGGQHLTQVADVLQDKPLQNNTLQEQAASKAMPDAGRTTMSAGLSSGGPQKTAPPKPGEQRAVPFGQHETTAASGNSPPPAAQGRQSDPVPADLAQAEVAKDRLTDNPNTQLPADPLSGQDAPQSTRAGQTVSSTPSVVPGERVVQFQFNKDCWLEVRDADGNKVFTSMAHAGETKTFRVKAPLAVLLGNASGVTIRVDGKPFDFSRYRNKSQIARFHIPAADHPQG